MWPIGTPGEQGNRQGYEKNQPEVSAESRHNTASLGKGVIVIYYWRRKLSCSETFLRPLSCECAGNLAGPLKFSSGSPISLGTAKPFFLICLISYSGETA